MKDLPSSVSHAVIMLIDVKGMHQVKDCSTFGDFEDTRYVLKEMGLQELVCNYILSNAKKIHKILL